MKDHPSTTDTIEAAIDSIKADVPSVTEIASASERVHAAIDSQRGPQAVVAQGPESPATSEN